MSLLIRVLSGVLSLLRSLRFLRWLFRSLGLALVVTGLTVGAALAEETTATPTPVVLTGDTAAHVTNTSAVLVLFLGAVVLLLTAQLVLMVKRS